MEMPKFLLGDNTDFPEDIFILHLEYPRFIVNLKNDELELLEEVEELLQTTLDEEKAADEKLTEVAVAAVNIQANEEEEEVEEAGTQSKK